MSSGVFAQMPGAPPQVGSAVAELERYLDHMVRIEASDLYITANSPPVFKTNGVGLKGRNVLLPEKIDEMMEELLSGPQKVDLWKNLELNFALQRGASRFRVNVFRQRGATGLVVRYLRSRIRTIEELGYPDVMKDIAMSKRGLVLVVGGTGSGKSTALAAMIDHRNSTEAGHIVTIEDPIEFTHPHKMSIVTQREVGVDTHTFEAALKNALRQAPDVVVIGEIRDVQTMEAALAFAESGHLCVSTLHATNANQAIERIVNFFPPDRHHEVHSHLALNLRSVVSQRLVPSIDGGRAAALEILLDTPRIKSLIKSGEIDALKDAMDQSAPEGCRTFDSSLFELVANERVDDEVALKFADRPNDLRLRIERQRATMSGVRPIPDGGALRLLPDVPPAPPPTQRAAGIKGS